MNYVSRIKYREFCFNQNKGISLAVDILNDPKFVFEDYMGAVCYLGYRVLDNTFNDISYINNHLKNAEKILQKKLIEEANPEKISNCYRWYSSHTLLKAYLIIFEKNKEEFPYEILTKCFDDKIIEHHPSQIVNVLRAGAILYHYNKNKTIKEEISKKMEGMFLKSLKNKNISVKPEGFHKIVENMHKAMHVIKEPYDKTIVDKELSLEKNLDRYFYKVISMLT